MSSAEMQAITGFRAGSCNVREPSGERVIRRDTVRDRTLCGRNVEPSSVQNAVLQQRWPGSPQVQTSIMTHWTPSSSLCLLRWVIISRLHVVLFPGLPYVSLTDAKMEGEGLVPYDP